MDTSSTDSASPKEPPHTMDHPSTHRKHIMPGREGKREQRRKGKGAAVENIVLGISLLSTEVLLTELHKEKNGYSCVEKPK